MEVYLISLILIVATYGILMKQDIEKDKREKIILLVALGIMVLIFGLRGRSVGTDTNTYLDLYNQIGNTPVGELNRIWTEYGYNIWNKLIYSISKSEQVFLILTGIFILGSGIYFIYKNSLNKLYSLFLYIAFMFFFSSMNIMRQFIALGIVFIALEFLYKEKNKLFFITIIIAAIFHETAIINLIFYFIRNRKFIYKKMLIVSGILFVLIKIRIIDLIVSFTSFDGYMKTKLYGKGSWIHFMMYLAILVFIIGVIEMIKREKFLGIIKTKFDMRENIILWGVFFSVIMQLCATQIQLFSRLAMYYMPFVIIAIPNTLELIEDRKIKRILYIVITIASILYMGLYIYKGGQGVIPYKFFWE